ncbi:condensation domain-containing protein [Plantactinospora sp. KBS50]|uniref:condensation domain-containing protein n=1 Tax=Plantactinospora sp. KBS50 TaxID=2024580 RepID=UPI0018DF30F6|nr:condensation domain-containing protein [Plantactinospora sp. KBS50]
MVVLTALPRTPDGDYDLDLLPDVTVGGPAAPTPPRTPYEEVVHEIWGDVLGVPDFGVHDDFFELGGHSLLAPRIVGRIRETLGVEVQVGDFFGSRTVAALAATVAARSAAGPRVIERRADRAEAVLSFDQQRIWLENQLVPSLAYNVHGRQRLIGPLDTAALADSVRAILVRHEALRTRFPLVNGRPVQVVDDLPEDWRLDVHDLRGLADGARRADRLADEQAGTAFDLTAGPLIRCLLVRLGEAEHVLSITAHHIVCDEWSIGLFLRELSALYAAGGDPARAGLEPLPIQYRDYAAWQREHLVGETLERTVAYWREHLADAPPALTLPVRHDGTTVRDAGDRARVQLGADETAAVQEFCRARGVSPFMLLMATLATVLARWSGQRDLVIGVPVAGRTDAGTDTLIGFLLNTLPIRVDLSDEPTFTDLLARVRRVCLDGYAHADAPLDVLVQQLDVVRDPRRTPLFQVVLNVVGGAPTTRLSGITVESMDSAAALPTKFDLSLNVQESDARLFLQLDYNPQRHAPAMVEALVAHLVTLLGAVVADPSRPVLDYPLDAGPAGPAGPQDPAAAPDPAAPSRPAAPAGTAAPAGSSTPGGTAAPGAPPAEHAAVVTPTGRHCYGWLADATAAMVPGWRTWVISAWCAARPAGSWRPSSPACAPAPRTRSSTATRRCRRATSAPRT